MTIYSRWGMQLEIVGRPPQWEEPGKLFLCRWTDGEPGRLSTYPMYEFKADGGFGEVLKAIEKAQPLTEHMIAKCVVWNILPDEIEKECLEIQWLIFKHKGMAVKSEIEDIIMARHRQVDRGYIHEVLNSIEYRNLTLTEAYGKDIDPPTLEDYPEIFQFVGRWYWR